MACSINPTLGFSLYKHRIVDKSEQLGLKGMRIWIKYMCEKMTNIFYVDVVMNIKTNTCEKNYHQMELSSLFRLWKKSFTTNFMPFSDLERAIRG